VVWIIIIALASLIAAMAFDHFVPGYLSQLPSGIDRAMRPVYHFGEFLSIGVTAAIGFVLIGAIITSRWSKPRIFVSYHLEDSDDAAIIARFLSAEECTVYVDPQDQPLRDELIHRIKENLRAADAIVVLSHRRKSFVDSEVLAAATLEKPVILLIKSTDDFLPDTAFSGYPTFSYPRLEKDDFNFLASYIKCILKHWSWRIQLIRSAFSGMNDTLLEFAETDFFRQTVAISVLGSLMRLVTYAFHPAISLRLIFNGIVQWLILLLIVGTVLWAFVFIRNVVSSLRNSRIARQTGRSRRYSVAERRNILGRILPGAAYYLLEVEASGK
jgi:TIR domain